MSQSTGEPSRARAARASLAALSLAVPTLTAFFVSACGGQNDLPLPALDGAASDVTVPVDSAADASMGDATLAPDAGTARDGSAAGDGSQGYGAGSTWDGCALFAPVVMYPVGIFPNDLA